MIKNEIKIEVLVPPTLFLSFLESSENIILLPIKDLNLSKDAIIFSIIKNIFVQFFPFIECFCEDYSYRNSCLIFGIRNI